MQQQQAAWVGDNQHKLLNLRHDRDVEYLRGLLDQQQEAVQHTNKTSNIPLPMDAAAATTANPSRYSLPYLRADAFVTFAVLSNPQTYHAIRKWLVWNETACCQRKADLDARVYHFRNFLTELGQKRSFSQNFVELSPERTAQHLFGPTIVSHKNNHSGSYTTNTSKDRILVVSRYPENLEPFSEALIAFGYNVTLSTAQKGLEDFCLLMSARRELVGSIRSTFTRWAAILGNATSNRLFTVRRSDDQGVAAASNSGGSNWTKGRVQRLDDGRVFYWNTPSIF